MRKYILFVLCFFAFSLINGNTDAQTRTKLYDGVYLVDYFGTYVIEDDNNGVSISLEVKQEQLDDKNNEMMYKVVCNGVVKRVAKWALRKTIEASFAAAANTAGATLLPAALSLAADIAYDKACEYWEKDINKRKNRYQY